MDSIPPLLKNLFSSKLRVRILSHFFFHPGESFHVRGLARAVEEPVGSVAGELARLEESGVLRLRRIGNQKHYALSPQSPILNDLRNIFVKTAGASAEIRRALEGLPDVEMALIYGSFASGQAGPQSDIDLMVIGKIPDRRLAAAIAEVERGLSREINYVLYTREETLRRIRQPGDFVHEILAGPRIMIVGSEDDGLFRAD